MQRVAEGGEIPIASLRELADLVLRSELVAVSQQLLDGPPEFALRRAMELAGLILASVATDEPRGRRGGGQVRRVEANCGTGLSDGTIRPISGSALQCATAKMVTVSESESYR